MSCYHYTDVEKAWDGFVLKIYPIHKKIKTFSSQTKDSKIICYNSKYTVWRRLYIHIY